MKSQQKFYSNQEAGFTLIELIMVISIIGLLGSIMVAAIAPARASARDAKRIQEMRTLNTAIVSYYLDNDNYPFVGSGGTTYADIFEGIPIYLLSAQSDDKDFSTGKDGARSWAQFVQLLQPYIAAQTIVDPLNGRARSDGAELRYEYFMEVDSNNAALKPLYFRIADCSWFEVPGVDRIPVAGAITAYFETHGNMGDYLQLKACPGYSENAKIIQYWLLP